MIHQPLSSTKSCTDLFQVCVEAADSLFGLDEIVLELAVLRFVERLDLRGSGPVSAHQPADRTCGPEPAVDARGGAPDPSARLRT